jgi:peptidoglycan hydrolase-like protein with peptidoglycan-binding domain
MNPDSERVDMIRKLVSLAVAGLLLAACGETTEDRAISGAGIGAGAGAVLGAVTGLSIVEGVLIGAAAGGATGALTNENQINLGTPVWKSGSKSSGGSAQTASADRSMVRDIQGALNAKGYNAGPADGIAGSKTRAAISQYQQDKGLLVDGQPSAALLQHLQGG